MKDTPFPHRRATMRALERVKSPKAYRISNAAGAEADVRIYDEIGFWGINAEDFARELSAVTAPTIRLHINSPGGSVFDGLAMYNTLKQHAAKVITQIDGVAASIASVIALAGDEVHMGDGTFVMIHNPWSIVLGDAAAMRQEAELLDKVAGSIAGIYAARTGKTVDEIRQLMTDETWWTAAEAIDAGYATAVSADPADTKALAAKFDFSIFAHAPAALRTDGPPNASSIDTIRDFEAFLRDAGGFSADQAKRIASAGFKAQTDPSRDEPDPVADLEPLAELATAIRAMGKP